MCTSARGRQAVERPGARARVARGAARITRPRQRRCLSHRTFTAQDGLSITSQMVPCHACARAHKTRERSTAPVSSITTAAMFEKSEAIEMA